MDSVLQRSLLKLARKSINYYLENRELFQPSVPDDPELCKERAVFVTLNRRKELRGCIGHMVARMPLYKAVSEMAVAAAFEDYRFSHVTENEIKQINIEISVLSPMEKIDDHKKIRLGIDGVLIQNGFRSGVYLPQVATETGWDLETFLGSLCAHKAGLSRDAYLDKSTEIFTFQVEKFCE